MKRPALAAALLTLSGCACAVPPSTTVPEQVIALPRPVCNVLVPHSDHDPDGILLDQFANGRILDYVPRPEGGGAWIDTATGRAIGWSAAEDAAIYDSPGCTLSFPAYPRS